MKKNLNSTIFIYTVKSGEMMPTVSLARFIRDHAYLKGTKISCNQGGCGACVVTVKVPDLVTGTKKTMSINSVSVINILWYSKFL